MRGLNRLIPRVPWCPSTPMRSCFDDVTEDTAMLVNRRAVTLTWFPGLCEIVLAALFPTAVLHFQSIVWRLPCDYIRFHLLFKDNGTVTRLSLPGWVQEIGSLGNCSDFPSVYLSRLQKLRKLNVTFPRLSSAWGSDGDPSSLNQMHSYKTSVGIWVLGEEAGEIDCSRRSSSEDWESLLRAYPIPSAMPIIV